MLTALRFTKFLQRRIAASSPLNGTVGAAHPAKLTAFALTNIHFEANLCFHQNCILLFLFNKLRYTSIRSIAIKVYFPEVLYAGVEEKNSHKFSQK